jgi:hypothetical protein
MDMLRPCACPCTSQDGLVSAQYFVQERLLLWTAASPLVAVGVHTYGARREHSTRTGLLAGLESRSPFFHEHEQDVLKFRVETDSRHRGRPASDVQRRDEETRRSAWG